MLPAHMQAAADTGRAELSCSVLIRMCGVQRPQGRAAADGSHAGPHQHGDSPRPAGAGQAVAWLPRGVDRLCQGGRGQGHLLPQAGGQPAGAAPQRPACRPAPGGLALPCGELCPTISWCQVLHMPRIYLTCASQGRLLPQSGHHSAGAAPRRPACRPAPGSLPLPFQWVLGEAPGRALACRCMRCR